MTASANSVRFDFLPEVDVSTGGRVAARLGKEGRMKPETGVGRKQVAAAARLTSSYVPRGYRAKPRFQLRSAPTFYPPLRLRRSRLLFPQLQRVDELLPRWCRHQLRTGDGCHFTVGSWDRCSPLIQNQPAVASSSSLHFKGSRR